jgi:hypothetical protein
MNVAIFSLLSYIRVQTQSLQLQAVLDNIYISGSHSCEYEDVFAQMMETVNASATLVSVYDTTLRNIPGDIFGPRECLSCPVM